MRFRYIRGKPVQVSDWHELPESSFHDWRCQFEKPANPTRISLQTSVGLEVQGCEAIAGEKRT